jgi:hypothetical protein
MEGNIYRKILIVGILFLFIGTGFSSVIGSNYKSEEDVSSLTFYTFSRTGTKKCELELPTNVIEEISDMFMDLKNKIIIEPTCANTQQLKNDFVDLIESYGLIPRGISKDYVVSLLNPSWLKGLNSNSPFLRNGFFSSFGSRLGKIFDLDSSSYTGSATFCSVAGGGSGLQFPPIMIPRPRFVHLWAAYIDAYVTAANLLTGRGFAASGPQFGLNLGFMGLGLTWAIPGLPAHFAFGGYSLFTMVGAEEIETYPLNNKPIISAETPSDGSNHVTLSLSELSFRISDADGERMNYWVTTKPDIGSGSGFNKRDGRYSVSVSNLEYDKTYRWTVRVSDGKSEIEKTFGFLTVTGPPFDPFEEGWKYRKKITIDHYKVAGDLSDFPVLVNIVDSDLKNKAQVDGDDILFMDDVGVANKLSHEIEKWDGSSGELIVWVNVNSLSSSSDTEIWLYYGNNDASNQEYISRTWNSNFLAVWHMDDNTPSSITDSTSYGYDGTKSSANNPVEFANGKIGKCQDFNNDFINCSDIVEMENTAYLTMECWYYADAFNYDKYNLLIGKEKGSDGKSRVNIMIDADVDRILLACGNGQNGFVYKDGLSQASAGSWHHVAYVYDGSESGTTDELKLFIDGTVETGMSGTSVPDTTASNNAGFHMGKTENTKQVGWTGKLDEVRLYKKAVSNGWIKTDYNSIQYGYDGGFFNVGPEEIGP